MNETALRKFQHNSAASKMTTKIPVATINDSIADVLAAIQTKMKQYETINYIYVIDSNARLLGTFSIKQVFSVPKSKKVTEIMDTDLVTVHSHTHQEKVALLAIHHNLKSIPVVDKENKLLGVVPSDVILSILHDEHIEDALHAAGIHKFKDPATDIIKADALTHFKKRLPWLVLGLLGGIFAAFVVGSFEEALETQLFLALFIPTVVYIADAVGTQTQTVFIRSIAIDRGLNIKQYLGRELQVSLLLAMVLGILASIISYFWLNTPLIGAILGISIFVTTIMAAAIAMFLPWLFLKTNYDPAVASGPFATIIRDILSLLIYFTIAMVMITHVI